MIAPIPITSLLTNILQHKKPSSSLKPVFNSRNLKNYYLRLGQRYHILKCMVISLLIETAMTNKTFCEGFVF